MSQLAQPPNNRHRLPKEIRNTEWNIKKIMKHNEAGNLYKPEVQRKLLWKIYDPENKKCNFIGTKARNLTKRSMRF